MFPLLRCLNNNRTSTARSAAKSRACADKMTSKNKDFGFATAQRRIDYLATEEGNKRKVTIWHCAAAYREFGDKKGQRTCVYDSKYRTRCVTEGALLKVSWWLILSSIWVPTQQSDIYSKKRAKSLTAHETVENAAIENKESYRNICRQKEAKKARGFML